MTDSSYTTDVGELSDEEIDRQLAEIEEQLWKLGQHQERLRYERLKLNKERASRKEDSNEG